MCWAHSPSVLKAQTELIDQTNMRLDDLNDREDQWLEKHGGKKQGVIERMIT